MAVRLSKGQKVDLTKNNRDLTKLIVGLGWDVSRYSGSNFDLDASAFLLDSSGKVQSESDFVFYNNPTGANGSVMHSGDNRKGDTQGDDEQIFIELPRVPEHISRIGFTITINDADIRRQNFGMVSNAYVRILNGHTNELLLQYDLGQQFSVETAIVTAELYRHGAEWKFNAIGSGFKGGLAALCKNFGLEVEEERSTPSFQQQSTPNYGTPYSGGNSMGGNSNNTPYQSPNYNAPSGNNQYGTPSFGQPQYGGSPNSQPQYGQPSHGGSQFGQPQYGQPSHGGSQYTQPQYGHTPHSGSQYSQPQYGTHSGGGMDHSHNIVCPYCQSNRVTAGKKGFGIGKAAVGVLLLGPIGLLGGFIGKDKMEFACLTCGKRWAANGNSNVSQWLDTQARQARDVFNRHMGQDLVDAVVAGCALVSAADGVVEYSEREKMINYFRTSDSLRSADINRVINRFEYFTNRIQMDPYLGKTEALHALGKLRQKPDAARMVVRLCCAIGFADGDFSGVEKNIVAEICRELYLNPAEFIG